MVNQENCIIDNTLLFICIHLEFLLSKAAIGIRVGEDPAIAFDPSGAALQKRQESQCGTRSGIVQRAQWVLLGWGCHLSAHISLQLHLLGFHFFDFSHVFQTALKPWTCYSLRLTRSKIFATQPSLRAMSTYAPFRHLSLHWWDSHLATSSTFP